MSIKFKRNVTVFIGLFFAIISCWYFFFLDKTGDFKESNDVDILTKKSEVAMPKVVTPKIVEERAKTEGNWDELFNFPVNFWGKVVDENGSPLAGATVQVILYDDPTGGYSGIKPTKIKTRSDAKGNFSILGKFAAGVSVNVSLSGYKPYYDSKTRENRSRVLMPYSDRRSDQKIKYSTVTEPTVLVLQKKGELSDLVYIEKVRQEISPEGVNLNIQLEKKGHTIELNLRCLSSVHQPFNYEKYDWEAEVGVKGGSIQEIKDISSQVAPEDGYLQAFKFKMPAKHAKWSRESPSNKRDFWIQLDEGGYVRAQIKFVTGRKHLVYVHAWINADGNDFVIER